jgi:Helix-turn-helix domain
MSHDIARLLADPLRQRLLFEYDRPTSPSKAARRLRQPVNLVSYHTRVLHRRGWVELVRTERRRGAIEHFYRSTGARFIEDGEWEQVPRRLRHAIVLGTLSGTADEARAAALAGGFDEATAHLSRSLLDLDEEGVAAVAARLREMVDDVERIAAAARGRQPPGQGQHELVVQFFRASPAP